MPKIPTIREYNGGTIPSALGAWRCGSFRDRWEDRRDFLLARRKTLELGLQECIAIRESLHGTFHRNVRQTVKYQIGSFVKGIARTDCKIAECIETLEALR